ncbi:hypothetical protein ACHAW6_000050 [Cyclotella cf. meneghiniana]
MFTEMTGRALAFKLASQAKLKFQSVTITFLPGIDYLKQINDSTKDIAIQCFFNNTGFIITRFVDQTVLPKLLSNMECNATAAFPITHLFFQ